MINLFLKNGKENKMHRETTEEYLKSLSREDLLLEKRKAISFSVYEKINSIFSETEKNKKYCYSLDQYGRGFVGEFDSREEALLSGKKEARKIKTNNYVIMTGEIKYVNPSLEDQLFVSFVKKIIDTHYSGIERNKIEEKVNSLNDHLVSSLRHWLSENNIKPYSVVNEKEHYI